MFVDSFCKSQLSRLGIIRMKACLSFHKHGQPRTMPMHEVSKQKISILSKENLLVRRSENVPSKSLMHKPIYLVPIKFFRLSSPPPQVQLTCCHQINRHKANALESAMIVWSKLT